MDESMENRRLSAAVSRRRDSVVTHVAGLLSQWLSVEPVSLVAHALDEALGSSESDEGVFTPEQEARIRGLIREELARTVLRGVERE